MPCVLIIYLYYTSKINIITSFIQYYDDLRPLKLLDNGEVLGYRACTTAYLF